MTVLKKIIKYLSLVLVGVFTLAILAVIIINTFPDLILSSISRSHIEANVPNGSDFDQFLNRDLRSYFSRKVSGDVMIKYEMLRNGPTQSGTAYPKYYLWVTVTSAAGKIEGAALVAAVDKEGFDIIDFVSKEDVSAHPEDLQKIFPQKVIEKIAGYVN